MTLQNDWWGYSQYQGWVVLDRSDPRNESRSQLYFTRCSDWQNGPVRRDEWHEPGYTFATNYISRLPGNEQANEQLVLQSHQREWTARKAELAKEKAVAVHRECLKCEVHRDIDDGNPHLAKERFIANCVEWWSIDIDDYILQRTKVNTQRRLEFEKEQERIRVEAERLHFENQRRQAEVERELLFQEQRAAQELFISRINEELICVLIRNPSNGSIELDSVEIVNPLDLPLNGFLELCNSHRTALSDLIEYLQKTPTLNALTGRYKYCESLSKPYQGVDIDNQFTVKEIVQFESELQAEEVALSKRLIAVKANKSDMGYERKQFDDWKSERVASFKRRLFVKYAYWGRVYAITKTYRICANRSDVLTFSHRLTGWSNPVYKLTDNFSVEIKTNFGYGQSSYFYTKFKFKDIEITPFSEWIDYRFAKIEEIVRYSKRHALENRYWFDAITYAKDACNMSLTDEDEFVSVYILIECERMVSGLENILTKEKFTFKDAPTEDYSLDKYGRVLMEFRGEKISGALDFIAAILTLKCIANTQQFVERILYVNRTVQPILSEELPKIQADIALKANELEAIASILQALEVRNINYFRLKKELRRRMITLRHADDESYIEDYWEESDVEDFFLEENPDYAQFREDINICASKVDVLGQQLSKLTEVYESIDRFNKKIVSFFLKTNETPALTI